MKPSADRPFWVPAHLSDQRKGISMLVDIILARSATGGDRDRDDLHRHATFYCDLRRFFRKLFRLHR